MSAGALPAQTSLRARSAATVWDRLIVPPGAFRLILAYLVVVGHFTPIHFGLTAVFVFFMLSGFWIDRMWVSEYARTARPYLTFVVSRFWRLLPVYYVSLAISIAAGAFVHAVPPDAQGWQRVHLILSHLTILGYASLPLVVQRLPAVWSLDVELQFYLVAPVAIAAFARYAPASWQRIAVYAVAALGFVAFLVFYTGRSQTIPQSAFLPMFLIFFLIGLRTARDGWKPSARLATIGLGLALALIALCVAFPATRELLVARKVHGSLADFNPEIDAVIAFLLAAYAMATVSKPAAVATRASRFDRDLGNLSYEIYLLHANAELLVQHFFGTLSRHARLPILIAVGIALFPVSWLVLRYVDRPIDRLRSRWVRAQIRVDRPIDRRSEAT